MQLIKNILMIINPFVVSGKIAPEYFCDRIEEACQLSRALENQLNVVLTSERRMGKTSLIDFVLDKPEFQNDYIIVSLDILYTSTFREFVMALGSAVFNRVASRSDKWRKQFVSLLKSLTASFSYDPIQNTPTFNVSLGDIQRPEYTLTEIMEYLDSVDKPCIVVIDEFQQITRYPENNVEAILRTHIQKMSNAVFVFSGSRRRIMEEMFFSSKRPFYQSAKPLRLEPINETVYLSFATRHFQNAGKELMADAFHFVYSKFFGVTFYIQRILKDAFSTTPKGDICSLESISQTIEDYLDENDSRLREQLSYLTEVQKEVLYAIYREHEAHNITSMAFCKKYRLRSPSSTQSASNKLLSMELITRENNVYRISDPLLNLWLQRIF